MGAIDTSSSSNGRGSDAWSRSWIHLGIDRRSAGYCRVMFDHPPTNAITARTVMELGEIVELINEDSDLNVVVFASANPGFYLTHGDTEIDPGVWRDLLVGLSSAPVVSIASIGGHVGGAGGEFVLACDLRFASRASTTLAAWLDEEIDRIASRIAQFDHEAIARIKSSVG